MRYMSVFWLFTVLLFGSGCATLDLREAYAMRDMTINDIDPSNAKIAIIWPDDIGVSVWILSISGKYDGQDFASKSVLIERQDDAVSNIAANTLALRNGLNSKNISIYGVSSDLLPDARDILSQMSKIKMDKVNDDTERWEAQLGLTFLFDKDKKKTETLCTIRDDYKITFWVKANAKEPYRRLINGKDISKYINQALKQGCTEP